jgi:hypothetical protein
VAGIGAAFLKDFLQMHHGLLLLAWVKVHNTFSYWMTNLALGLYKIIIEYFTVKVINAYRIVRMFLYVNLTNKKILYSIQHCYDLTMMHTHVGRFLKVYYPFKKLTKTVVCQKIFQENVYLMSTAVYLQILRSLNQTYKVT